MNLTKLPNVILASWLTFFLFWGEAIQALAEDEYEDMKEDPNGP